jgi:transposase
MAVTVNFVFNYCNETSIKAIKRDHRFLSWIDLHALTAGSSKELGIHSQTIQKVCEEYVHRRKQFKKIKLNWRTSKRHTGWIPFRGSGIILSEDTVKYFGNILKFWKSRSLPEGSVIKGGNFNSDRRNRWYVNIQVEVPDPPKYQGTQPPVGIDLGLKIHMSLSDGTKYGYPKYYRLQEEKLGKAQRAHKKNQIKSINAKIANQRKDWLHKKTTDIVNKYGAIYVGDVNSSKLIKTNMSKSVMDSGWFMAKTFFGYKSQKLGKVFEERHETWSSCTCSVCLEETGPRGLSQLGIREWVCSNCGTLHDRDTNAALNILNPPSGHRRPNGNPWNLFREDAKRQETECSQR